MGPPVFSFQTCDDFQSYRKEKKEKKRKESETNSEVFPSFLLSFPSLEKMGVDSFIFVLSLL